MGCALSCNALAERHYLKKDEVFCDSNRQLCLHGTLSYNENPRVIELRARIQKQTGAGTLRLELTGTTRQGDLRRTEIVLTVRGKHSEIVRHQMRPDAPDVQNWQLLTMAFYKDTAD